MKLLRAAFFVLAAASFGFGQSSNSGFTIEQVMSAPFTHALTAAEHSSRVAWTFDMKGERNVWVADAPEYKPRQVTHYVGDNGQEIDSLRLTPDGKFALYSRGSEVNGAGRVANPTSLPKPPKQQVWAVDLDGGGEPRPLGDMGCEEEDCENIQISPDSQWAVWVAKRQLWIAPISATAQAPGAPLPANGTAQSAEAKPPAQQFTDVSGGVSDPQWSADGKHIAARISRRDHSFIAIFDRDPLAIHYIAPTTNRDMYPRWSPDGRHLVFVRTHGVREKQPLIPVRPNPWSLWLADVTNYTAKELWRSGEALRDSLPIFADSTLHYAADERILFNSEQDGRNHLYAISAQGGEPKLLTPGDFDVEDVTLSADKRSVIYSSNQASTPEDVDRRHIWQVALVGGAPKQLTKGESIEWNPVETGAGGNLLCIGSTAQISGLPQRITASGLQAIAKDKIPQDFPATQLVTPKQVTFKSEDGYTIHGQLFVPKNLSGKAPALIFTHGGPQRQMLLGWHYMQYYSNAYAQNQYLASRGYIVLSVNYRLGIMYGRDFREAPHTVWRGGYEYKDVVAGARYLQSLPQVDATRMGLWGGSYGGYLTAMGLAHNSDIFKVGVDFHGVHDWSDFLPEWEDGDVRQAPDVKEAAKVAFESSPDAFVSQWKSPVLLIHGDDDRNVPFTQTTDLAERLREQKVEFEELIFPDEIHDLLLWRDWIAGYKAGAEFFDRHLKPNK